MTPDSLPPPILLAAAPGSAAASSNSGALTTFAIYLVGVFLLAWLSQHVRQGKRFVSEYFLGSRSFGMWAFALTFAATSSSGGSFMGFPALIYSHGWALALWIASYMVVPIVGMGLMGKRINQVARRTGALTVPEMIEERFNNRNVGTVAIVLVVVFMFFYLLAQFKAGSKILSTLLADVAVFQNSVDFVGRITRGIPWIGQAEPEYLLCLVIFAAAVIIYVVYGGFRAVVWTDIMQGFVMFAGVLIMLVLVLSQVGGLENATRQLAGMPPPEFGAAKLRIPEPRNADTPIPSGSWFKANDGDMIKTTGDTMIPAGARASAEVGILRLTYLPESARIAPSAVTAGIRVEPVSREPYKFGAGQAGVYTRAPGPSRTNELGYLSIGMAFSFFVFWAFGSSGQPSNMVRLMAFKDTRTLRRAMVTVAVYYSIIYFSLVVIFCCARVLLPGMDNDPDSIMPELAAHLTAAAGWPWLAGVLLAAPFAAVMSSVDSFLLMLSSSLVRDIYQRRVNPGASEKKIRRFAHLVTTFLGVAAILAILNPPEYLQVLIVFASGGLTGCFLVPVALALYWQRFNATGMIAGMAGGFATHVTLTFAEFAITGRFGAYELFGIHPLLWDLLGSALCCVPLTLLSQPPDPALVRKFFAATPMRQSSSQTP